MIDSVPDLCRGVSWGPSLMVQTLNQVYFLTVQKLNFVDLHCVTSSLLHCLKLNYFNIMFERLGVTGLQPRILLRGVS